MAQRSLIVSELKRSLREQGLTYAVVARKLELSVASVKRLFSVGDLSLGEWIKFANYCNWRLLTCWYVRVSAPPLSN